MAGMAGIEPARTESKSVVLPLDYIPKLLLEYEDDDVTIGMVMMLLEKIYEKEKYRSDFGHCYALLRFKRLRCHQFLLRQSDR